MDELEQYAHVSGFWTPPRVRAQILERAQQIREDDVGEQTRCGEAEPEDFGG